MLCNAGRKHAQHRNYHHKTSIIIDGVEAREDEFPNYVAERGVADLFAGVVPQVLWISVEAAIYLGSCEKAIKVLC